MRKKKGTYLAGKGQAVEEAEHSYSLHPWKDLFCTGQSYDVLQIQRWKGWIPK